MNVCEFFVRLSHHLGSYDDASLLNALLTLGADQQPVRYSASKLAKYYIGLSKKRIQRSADRLVAAGLLSVRVYPKTWTEYAVSAEALMALLRIPIDHCPFPAGLSSKPIPFLSRFSACAESALPEPSIPLSRLPEVCS